MISIFASVGNVRLARFLSIRSFTHCENRRIRWIEWHRHQAVCACVRVVWMYSMWNAVFIHRIYIIWMICSYWSSVDLNGVSMLTQANDRNAFSVMLTVIEKKQRDSDRQKENWVYDKWSIQLWFYFIEFDNGWAAASSLSYMENCHNSLTHSLNYNINMIFQLYLTMSQWLWE